MPPVSEYDNGCAFAGIFFPSSFYTTGLQSQESRIPEEQNRLIRTAEHNYRGDFSHFSAFFVCREEKEKNWFLSNPDGGVDSKDHKLIQVVPDT